MEAQTRPEPMNATQHHSKVKVAMTFARQVFVAGDQIAGKMEMECKADKGLGINVIMVELFAIQELTSRDHSATSTFLHSRRMFQGPNLPPSNAVQAHPLPGDPPLPQHYHQARRGVSTFLFRFPIPPSSPSTINFGSGLARLRYEVRASVGVFWKDQKLLVTDKKEIDIVESFEESFVQTEPEAVIVGENGKLWAQGKVVGGIIVAGESGCVELQVKNHSNKKNAGLSLSLTRYLHLPDIPATEKSPLQISDTLTTVAFKSPEYIVPPGAEGVASLVFDVPKYARGVKGGHRHGDPREPTVTNPLFEVRCVVTVKLLMGIGSKDIVLDLPVKIIHPVALPNIPPPPEPFPYATPPLSPFDPRLANGYPYPALPLSPSQPLLTGMPLQPGLPLPPMAPYMIDPSHVWIPPPQTYSPNGYQVLPAPVPGQMPYYYPPPPGMLPAPGTPPVMIRSGSAGNVLSAAPVVPVNVAAVQAQGGTGDRTSRITQALHETSRNRSASPQPHRVTAVPVQQASGATLEDLAAAPVGAAATRLLVSPNPVAIHSPRPVLSPKHSFSVDPATHNSIPKSERVEKLEEMAAKVATVAPDLSGDLPKAGSAESPGRPDYLDKTLPGPPVPTGRSKPASVLPSNVTKTRLDTIFSTIPEDPVPSSSMQEEEPPVEAPPTPTLQPMTPSARPRHTVEAPATPTIQPKDRATMKGLAPTPAGRSESGLDALERRLLMEVGTRKVETSDKRPDVRGVMTGSPSTPMAIPQPKNVPEPLNDSAISSFDLAEHERHNEDHESDEGRTHKAGKSIGGISGDDREGKASDREREKGKSKERKHGKRKEKEGSKEKEKSKDSGLRKAAKGRVADWLTAIEPEIPPMDALPGDEPELVATVRKISKAAAKEKEKEVEKESAPTVAPNVRSSGFVPIGTFKRPESRFTRPVVTTTQVTKVDVQKDDDLQTSPFAPALRPSPARTPPPPRTEKEVSPPSRVSFKHIPQLIKTAPSKEDKPEKREDKPIKPVAKAGPSPKLPVFPPPPLLDLEVKYDHRSARGGRGGKVTSITSLWASEAPDIKTKPVVPEPKPTLPVHAARPVRSAVRAPIVEPPTKPALPSPISHQRSPAQLATLKKNSSDGALKSSKTPPSIAVSKALISSPAPMAVSKASVSAPAPSRKVMDVTVERSRPADKSRSVPAMLSASLAKPTLSTTASLARSHAPISPSAEAKKKFAMPTITESTSTPSMSKSSPAPSSKSPTSPSSKAGDLSFGQARLRDLIRKYQGQPTT